MAGFTKGKQRVAVVDKEKGINGRCHICFLIGTTLLFLLFSSNLLRLQLTKFFLRARISLALTAIAV
ncbi:MAG: hypothetical protein PHD95_01255 [Candidatus ainarchaeum sp.]|nr:hypothetical protein [Candidatus ainarchaeum sp.]